MDPVDPATEAENRDLLAYLTRNGFGALVSAAGDPDCLRAGILSGNALAKRTGIPPRAAWRMMRQARAMIAEQLNHTDRGPANPTSIPAPSTLFSSTPTRTTSRSVSDCN